MRNRRKTVMTRCCNLECHPSQMFAVQQSAARLHFSLQQCLQRPGSYAKKNVISKFWDIDDNWSRFCHQHLKSLARQTGTSVRLFLSRSKPCHQCLRIVINFNLSSTSGHQHLRTANKWKISSLCRPRFVTILKLSLISRCRQHRMVTN